MSAEGLLSRTISSLSKLQASGKAGLDRPAASVALSRSDDFALSQMWTHHRCAYAGPHALLATGAHALVATGAHGALRGSCTASNALPTSTHGVANHYSRRCLRSSGRWPSPLLAIATIDWEQHCKACRSSSPPHQICYSLHQPNNTSNYLTP